MIYFQIFCSKDGKEWEFYPYSQIFENGASASKEAKLLATRFKDCNWSSYKNYRFRVRRFAEDDGDNFISREAAKNHTPLPFDFPTSSNLWFLPHVHPTMTMTARYFRSFEDCIAEKYSYQGYSRFLHSYAPWNEYEIEDVLTKVGYYKQEVEVGITQDATLIQEIYAFGPSSCMADEDEYSLPDDPHPVAVYGAGDLGVVYAKRGEHKYSTRAVVNMRDKTYYTVYGAFNFIAPWLEENGYTKDNNGRSFDGCRVAAIKYSKGWYLMPYIDACGYGRLDETGKFIILMYNDEFESDIEDDDGNTIFISAEYEVRSTEGYTYAL